MGWWWPPILQEAAVTLRDGIGLDDLAAWAGWLTAVCSFLWVALIRPARRFMRVAGDFLEDWSGHPQRPGHDAVPGIPERIQRIEREVQRNGGASLKDRVFETDRKVDALTAAQARTAADIDELRKTIACKHREDTD